MDPSGSVCRSGRIKLPPDDKYPASNSPRWKAHGPARWATTAGGVSEIKLGDGDLAKLAGFAGEFENRKIERSLGHGVSIVFTLERGELAAIVKGTEFPCWCTSIDHRKIMESC
jgi:hypothetical protein